MDDGYTVLREAPRYPARLHGAARRRDRARHRRRRRLLVALALATFGVAGAVILLGGAGAHHAGGAVRPAERSGAAAMPRPRSSPLAAAEDRAIDRTLARTPIVRIAGAQHREVALTFDDGPGPYTPAILRVLRRAGVPATFFEVGVLERYFHGATSAIVAAADVIGDHTEGHAPMARLSAFDQQQQLLEDATVIGQYGARFPRLFRPPYGLYNRATLALLRRYRMLMVLWTVDTSDYRRPGVRAIVHSAVAGARPGAIILLHDAGGDRAETVAALPKIIHALRARGYKLVTVPRLLLDNPAPANQKLSVALPGGG